MSKRWKTILTSFKNFGRKFKTMLKKYGIDGVLALIIFNFPMYAVLFIKGEEFKTFALWWTGIWWGLGPLTPGWLATIVLAIFLRWARLTIWKGILWAKEAMDKLQLQNQLASYLTAEEIKMILVMAKKIDVESDKKITVFREKLRLKRLKMIDEQWTKEVQVEENKKD
jgi:hypothetical protein